MVLLPERERDARGFGAAPLGLTRGGDFFGKCVVARASTLLQKKKKEKRKRKKKQQKKHKKKRKTKKGQTEKMKKIRKKVWENFQLKIEYQKKKFNLGKQPITYDNLSSVVLPNL